MPAPRWLRATVLALLGGHLAWSVWPGLTRISNDFPSYYVAARTVAEGRPLDRVYERAFWREEGPRAGLPTVGTFIPFPPANALLLVPLAGASPAVAKAVWSGVLALVLVASFITLRAILPEASPWLVALALLTQTASIRNALLYGQPYPLLLLLLGLSLLALLRGRDVVAGALLATVVVLKLYGLPFVLFLAVTRRWRAVGGVLAGAVAMTGLSVAILGWPVHVTYATQILGDSLDGRILDPYSTVWGSAASAARRLFAFEPGLNPHPAADVPWLARALGGASEVAIAVFAVAAATHLARNGRLRASWAVLVMGSLAASPLPSSYHMVMLALPVAILAGETDRPALRWTVVLLAAFAASPLPHHFAPLAHGWGNLVAPARLIALCALLALAVRGVPLRVPALVAGAAAVLAGSATVAARPEESGWTRVEDARGLLSAEPAACADGLSWLTIADGAYRYRRGDGTLVDAPPCAPARVSPDGTWVLSSEWTYGSWDLWVRNGVTGETRRVTSDPANEVEPAFLPDGQTIVFASDRRRGLGATTLYVIPFVPGDAVEERPFAQPQP